MLHCSLTLARFRFTEQRSIVSVVIGFAISSTVYAPLLRLSPPPGEHDYYFNLDDSEGVCDLFDIPNLDIPSPLPGAMASS